MRGERVMRGSGLLAGRGCQDPSKVGTISCMRECKETVKNALQFSLFSYSGYCYMYKSAAAGGRYSNLE